MPKASIILHGLATCDTTRAARKWLEANGISHVFHDVRADGLTRQQVEAWVTQLGWEKVLNKASTTWRELPESVRSGLDSSRAIGLMLQHPTLVKRPVLDRGGKLLVGFKPASYSAVFG